MSYTPPPVPQYSQVQQQFQDAGDAQRRAEEIRQRIAQEIEKLAVPGHRSFRLIQNSSKSIVSGAENISRPQNIRYSMRASVLIAITGTVAPEQHEWRL